MVFTFVGGDWNLGFESAGCWSLAFDRVRRQDKLFLAEDGGGSEGFTARAVCHFVAATTLTIKANI